MALLQMRKGTKVYPEKVIFRNASLQVQKQDRIGLIGDNGMGKSTLLQILTGEKHLDEGEFVRANQLEIGTLDQSFSLDPEATLYQEMLSVFQEVFALEEELAELEAEMSQVIGERLDKVMAKYSRRRQEYEEKEGYRVESKIKGVLRGLGFTESDFDRQLGTFSGGQKARASLAELLLQEPNLLLLDEPTNHLDLQAREWLEDYLQEYPGAVIIVSHDRYLLEKLANRIWELEKGRLEKYKGSYDFYLQERERRILTWQREYEQQQKQIKKLKAFIRKNKAGVNSELAHDRERKLERMDKVSPPPQLETPTFEFKCETTSGRDVLTGENLAKSYAEEVVFSEVDFRIYRGETVGVVGPNGSGKSTLFKIITGQETFDDGQLKLGSDVKVGYYHQEQEDLEPEHNLVEELQTAKKLTDGEARDVLARFLFTGEEVFKTVAMLSGGEKARLSLAKLSIQDFNLLLLDEPTNHLDIKSREQLEAALREYPGTIIVISHDRYFLDQLVDKVFAFQKQDLVEYKGNYSDYRTEYEQQQRIKQAQAEQENKEQPKEEFETEQGHQESEVDFEELETKIIELETRLEELEAKFDEQELYQDQSQLQDLTEEYKQIKEDLAEYYSRWEEII